MGLFVVQLLLIAYQLTFVLDAGRADSNARASRIPDGAVVGHLMLTIGAAALWFGWRIYGDRAWAWTSFGVLVVAAAIGTVIAQRSLTMPPVVQGPSEDPADLRTAESRIPEISQVLLGGITLVLLVFTLLVAAGVFS